MNMNLAFKMLLIPMTFLHVLAATLGVTQFFAVSLFRATNVLYVIL